MEIEHPTIYYFTKRINPTPTRFRKKKITLMVIGKRYKEYKVKRDAVMWMLEAYPVDRLTQNLGRFSKAAWMNFTLM